jgi:hypothetical protein
MSLDNNQQGTHDDGPLLQGIGHHVELLPEQQLPI